MFFFPSHVVVTRTDQNILNISQALAVVESRRWMMETQHAINQRNARVVYGFTS